MKGFPLFIRELRRLLRSRPTWLVILLTVLTPAAGLFLYRPSTSGTMLSTYLANPALSGGTLGSILFGLLTIYELGRTHRSRMDVLTDAAVSPLTVAAARLPALVAAALLAAVLTAAVWFPVTVRLAGAVLTLTDYVLAYGLFLGLALPLAILAAAAAYQFARRADLSLVILTAFAALSLSAWADNWQLRWLNPSVWAMSDDFSNFRLFRATAYLRLTWLAGLAGVWVVSCLCIRQYGMGPAGSLLRSVRRIYRPAAALLLLACAGTAYAAQPFYDHSNPDLSAMELYEQPYAEDVTCQSRTFRLFPDTSAGTVSGQAAYRFQNRSGLPQTICFGVNPGYEITSAEANGSAVTPVRTGYEESGMALWTVEIPGDAAVELVLEYGGFPTDWNISSLYQGAPEISSTYLCLENQNVAPYLLNVMPGEDGFPTTTEITLPAGMTVIPFNSNAAEVTAEHADGTRTWRYTSNSSGGILYAGDYVCETLRAGGITIEFYYGRRHQAVMEAAGAADAVQTVIDYCTAHYGPLYVSAGGSLKLIQSRVSGGGYAVDGASLLDEADFTAANLSDTAKGGGAGEVMIHELVHQWWGLGNMFDTSGPDSPWSAEGLTVYTSYRIAKELYGEAYAKEAYVAAWQQQLDDYEKNFYVRHPEYLASLPEAEQLEISNSLSGVRQYAEMPLKILKAEQLVGGEDAMDQILSGLFNREIDPMYPYLTYQDFLDACGLTEEALDLA